MIRVQLYTVVFLILHSLYLMASMMPASCWHHANTMHS